jgi:hypothetical protein
LRIGGIVKVDLICTTCQTRCLLDDETSDPSVDLAAFCLLWVRGKACRCAGFVASPARFVPPAEQLERDARARRGVPSRASLRLVPA